MTDKESRHEGKDRVREIKGVQEIDLYDYWKVIVRRKRLIALISSSVFAVSVVVSLLLPRSYAATASIMPPDQADSLKTGFLSKITGGLAGGGMSLLGGSNSSVDLWVGILKSRSIKDEVIKRFGLKERYGRDTLEDTRKTLDKNVSIDKSKEDIISITVYDKDPAAAARMANAFVEELDRINKGTVMTSGQRMRAFVEKRLAEAKTELERLEDSLKNFQEKNKAVKLDDQSKAIIDAIGTVKGELMAKEVELETLLSYATPNNPQVQLLKTEVSGLKEKLTELEQGTKGRKKNIFIPTDNIPDLAFRYARLLRDVKIQETLFELLTQQYEMARIQEAKDSPTIQVLDAASVPEKKARPKRTLIVSLSTLSGVVFSVLFSFFIEYIEKARMKDSADA